MTTNNSIESAYDKKARIFSKYPGNRIIHYIPGQAGSIEQFAFVRDVDDYGRIWITNYPEPLKGTMSKYVHENDIENIVDYSKLSLNE